MKSDMKRAGDGIGEVRVILHNIRSAHNVGSAFRTCDAAGVSHLYLCGYTSAPTDRFGRIRKDIAKVALGAEKTLPWKHEASAVDLLARLKKEGYIIIAVEQSPKAVDYKTIDLGENKIKKDKLEKRGFAKTAIIFGNEVEGVPAEILDICDVVAEIPMRGKKESLNVSVALGVALFRMMGI